MPSAPTGSATLFIDVSANAIALSAAMPWRSSFLSPSKVVEKIDDRSCATGKLGKDGRTIALPYTEFNGVSDDPFLQQLVAYELQEIIATQVAIVSIGSGSEFRPGLKAIGSPALQILIKVPCVAVRHHRDKTMWFLWFRTRPQRPPECVR